MEKKKIFYIEFLTLIVYILVFCLMPLVHGITFWVTFILSIIECIIAGIIIFQTVTIEHKKLEKMFELIKFRDTLIYSIVQLLFNIFSMCYGKLPIWSIIITNLIVTTIFIIIICLCDNIKQNTTRVDEDIREKVRSKNRKLVEVEQLQNKPVDFELRKSIGKLIEILKYSDPVSTPEVEELDKKIEINLAMLKSLIDEGKEDEAQNCCNELMVIIQERNNLCAIYK